MTEYIERGKAVEKITAYCELRQAICAICENDKDEFLRGLQTALKVISCNDGIPTADVQPVDRWISVDDRLPKNNKIVLCYCKSTTGEGNTYMLGALSNDEFWFFKKENGQYLSFPNLHLKVLYWQPLPEPPMED